MSNKANSIRDFLLEWIILHGDNWVFHNDAFEKDIMVLDRCRTYKFIEEEDQFPVDKYRWGSYFKLTKKGRKYATMR